MTKPNSQCGITVACGQELHDAIEACAQMQGVTMAHVCREILAAHFGVTLLHPPHGGARYKKRVLVPADGRARV